MYVLENIILILLKTLAISLSSIGLVIMTYMLSEAIRSKDFVYLLLTLSLWFFFLIISAILIIMAIIGFP